MIILVGGEKGGTAKSTIATTLAAMRKRRGRDILLIDGDAQGTATIWAEERAARGYEPRVPCIAKAGRAFLDDVRELSKRYEDLVIDAGGRDSRELRAGLVICDRFITPMQPSSADGWTLEKLEEMLNQVPRLDGQLVGDVVLTRAFTNPNIPETEDAIGLVNEYASMRFSGVVLFERLVYRRALGLGLSVEEMTNLDKKAVIETTKLYAHAFKD